MPISKELQQLWQLHRWQEIRAHVYAAESQIYGPVIVKQNSGASQAYAALRRMGSCPVYAFDEATGTLLEERIFPGTSLREEVSLENRVEALHQVLSSIHTPETEGETYLDWLDGACSLARVPEILQGKGEKARKICRELFEKYPERMLLHGDLHHDNILLRADGSYAVIDPKGVIGPEILDLPRFILNEGLDANHIRRVIGLMAERFGYPAAELAGAYYMEVILANLWCVEDRLPVSDASILLAEAILEEFT